MNKSSNHLGNTPVYLVFGPQGSGKSTQAQYLSEQLKLPFFDSGSELRELANSNNMGAERLSATIRAGNLVSNNILRNIFAGFIDNHNCLEGLVIDGFPRTLQQAKLLDELAKKHRWHIIAFFVDVSDKIAKERLSNRYKLINGKKVFRVDDKSAVVEKRLKLFKSETLPVIKWLKERFIMYKIDGEQDRDNVFNQMLDRLKQDEITKH